MKPQEIKLKKTCRHPSCNLTYSLVEYRNSLLRSNPNARNEIIEGAKTLWWDKGLCALHYDRSKRSFDMDAPIRTANINKIITG